MVYEKSLSERFIIYCAAHFRNVFALLIFILIIITFCKALFILINPIVINGTVVDYDIKGTRGGRHSGGVSINPVIQFQYENKIYHFEGENTYHVLGRGDEVEVIVNKSFPSQACEYSLAGFINFTGVHYTLPIGFFLACLLLAFRRAYTDNYNIYETDES